MTANSRTASPRSNRASMVIEGDASWIPTREEEEVTARHEAGHAVIGVVLRRQFRHVAIGLAKYDDGCVANGQVDWLSKGSFDPRLDSKKRTRFHAERNAIVQLAGPVAVGHKRSRGRAHGGFVQDFYYAEEQINHISRTRNKSRATWKRLWDQTEILVSDHRASIEAVAMKLLAKRRLSYREVRKIVALTTAQPIGRVCWATWAVILNGLSKSNAQG